MTRLQESLIRSATALGMKIVCPYELVLPSGAVIVAEAWVQGVGPRNGMLIVTSFSDLRQHLDELHEAGYGYSTLSEPAPGEAFDLDSFKEVFRDWGWSG